MLKILDETNEDLLAVRVTEKLTEKDFDRYRALIKERMDRFGSARLYFEMWNFSGWEPGSFLENALFDLVHRQKFRKVAMVGEKEWQRWAAGLADIVKTGKVRYFPFEERQIAMLWVNSGKPTES